MILTIIELAVAALLGSYFIPNEEEEDLDE